jgi:cytochrome P450
VTVTTIPIEFDPFSEEFFNDPYELYRRLHDEVSVYYSERYGFVALSRFSDVLAAHRDCEAFLSAHGIELFTLSKDPQLPHFVLDVLGESGVEQQPRAASEGPWGARLPRS